MSDDKMSGLYDLISNFTEGRITADAFENAYTDSFDFEDYDEKGMAMIYFSSIRGLLEHYSSSEKDLREWPDHYINENQLKQKIIELKR